MNTQISFLLPVKVKRAVDSKRKALGIEQAQLLTLLLEAWLHDSNNMMNVRVPPDLAVRMQQMADAYTFATETESQRHTRLVKSIDSLFEILKEEIEADNDKETKDGPAVAQGA